MRLQSFIGHRRGDKEYPKHQIVIPNNVIEQLGWNPREYLEPRVTKKGLFICKAEPKQQTRKLDYEQFRHAVIKTLTSLPKGCTWSELKSKAGLNQLTPSPIWVKRMEDEKALERTQDPVTSQIIWKLPNIYFITADKLTLNGWTIKNVG